MMRTFGEQRAGVITVLQARRSKNTHLQQRGWLWKTGAGGPPAAPPQHRPSSPPVPLCRLPSLVFCYIRECKQFFFPTPPPRREMLYLYFQLVFVSRYSAVPGSDGPPSNPRHQPSFDERNVEPFINKNRKTASSRSRTGAVGTAFPAPFPLVLVQ